MRQSPQHALPVAQHQSSEGEGIVVMAIRNSTGTSAVGGRILVRFQPQSRRIVVVPTVVHDTIKVERRADAMEMPMMSGRPAIHKQSITYDEHQHESEKSPIEKVRFKVNDNTSAFQKNDVTKNPYSNAMIPCYHLPYNHHQT